MSIKLLPLVLFVAAALLTPKVRSERNLDYHQTSTFSLSDQERILLLETFKDEQRDYNSQLDTRLVNQINTIVQTQTTQSRQISQLESRLDLVYRFGSLIAFILTLSIPVFLWILNTFRAHNAEIAKAISFLASDLRVIKTIVNFRGEYISQNQPSTGGGE